MPPKSGGMELIMFPYFELLGKTVGMYAVCAMLGLLLCGFLCAALGKHHGICLEDIVVVFIVTGCGILFGGHLLYGILQIKNMIFYIQGLDSLTFSAIISCLASGFGGSVFYGGFLGSLAAVSIYGKRKGALPIYLDLLAISTPLFHTFGRIGCFLGGCCYGIESPFGFVVHNNPYIPEINGVSRFPVQLLEAALNLLIFILIFKLYGKERIRGKLILIYMATYAPIRFALEFLRGDSARGGFLIFSTSQWISLLIFPIVLTVLFASRQVIAKKDKTTP